MRSIVYDYIIRAFQGLHELDRQIEKFRQLHRAYGVLNLPAREKQKCY